MEVNQKINLLVNKNGMEIAFSAWEKLSEPYLLRAIGCHRKVEESNLYYS